MVHPGDVFAVKLPDGRYSAVRVIKTDGRASLVSTSQYLWERAAISGRTARWQDGDATTILLSE